MSTEIPMGRSLSAKTQASHYEALNKTLDALIDSKMVHEQTKLKDVPAHVEAMTNELKRLRHRLQTLEEGLKEEITKRTYAYRGVETDRHKPCCSCLGSGVILWDPVSGREGCRKVCPQCWGSGLSTEPWPSHEKFRMMELMLKGANEDALQLMRRIVKELDDSNMAAHSKNHLFERGLYKECKRILGDKT